MYGHELIEDLKKNRKLFAEELLLKKIKTAAHFHFGETQPLFDLFKKVDQKQKLFDGILSASQMPYDNCVFFYDDEEYEKIALQLEKQENGDIEVYTFIIHPEVGWIFPGWGTLIKNAFSDEDTTCSTISAEETVHLYEKNKELIQRMSGKVASLLNVSIALLNTKNIETQENRPPIKLNKKRIKKGKQPLFTYHTLRLQLPGKRKKGSGASGTGDNTTMLHLCRGHFKTYTADAPLLGKFTGRYWWQPHARGNKDEGVVMKDYAVEIVN